MQPIITAAIVGIQALPVRTEADISRGLPKFFLTGLPDAAVRESRERIRAAIRNSGFSFPRTVVTVNLAPGTLKKEGTLFDLPIALSILSQQDYFTHTRLHDSVFAGELALDGHIRPVSGVLTIALMTQSLGYKRLFIPIENTAEAQAVHSLEVYGIRSLQEVVEHLTGKRSIPISQDKTPPPEPTTFGGADFFAIRGQELAKRGLEIAAAGAHNILLKGPPGGGKTLLARALPSLLPELSHSESLEVTAIASVAGVHELARGLQTARPFRSPHHSCSAVSLVGGGAWPRPGEVSLAHRGVLFLDELPEFSRHVLEHLRQPLEDGEVTISRAAATMKFPARFLLAAAMNPCPCGFATDPKRACLCTIRSILNYRKKISGPLLDRFDLIVDVPAVDPDKLLSLPATEGSTDVRERVKKAREIQRERFLSNRLSTNAEIPAAQFESWCTLTTESKALLRHALKTQHLTARGYARVCKVARTIADLEGAKDIKAPHIAEALQYRLQGDAS